MILRARFSAFFTSIRGGGGWLADRCSGPRYLSRAAHDLTSPAGFAPVTSHLRHLNLIVRLWLCERRDAIVRVLNPAHASAGLCRRQPPATAVITSLLPLCSRRPVRAVGLEPFLDPFDRIVGMRRRSDATKQDAPPRLNDGPSVFTLASFEGRARLWLVSHAPATLRGCEYGTPPIRTLTCGQVFTVSVPAPFRLFHF